MSDLVTEFQRVKGVGPNKAAQLVEIVEDSDHGIPAEVRENITTAYEAHYEEEAHHHARKFVKQAYNALEE